MGLCSCKAECNCAIAAAEPDNGLLLIIGDGNVETGGWKLKVIETPFSASGDGAIQVTNDGTDGHTPTFALQTVDSGTIALEVTEDGLVAHALSVGSSGGGTPTGTIEDYLGDTAPPGYVMASGPNYAGYIPIDDAPGLFGLVGHSESGGVDPGDGTFLVPYLGEKFLLGSGGSYIKDDVAGQATVALTSANNGPHGHGVTDPGHAHPAGTSIVANGAHEHAAGTAADSSFVTVENPVGSGDFVGVAFGTDVSIPTFPETNGATAVTKQQGNRQFTSNDGSHGHTASTTVSNGGTGITVNSDGSGTPHDNMPPYRVVHRIIKT